MENPPMRLYVSVKSFVIHWPEQSQYLIMERNTHRIYSSSSFRFPDQGISPEDIFFINIYFILGVIPIETVLYIAVVTRADCKGSLKHSKIYEINEIELIEFNRTEDHHSLEASISSIKKLLSSGFYFSYGYRLTQPVNFSGSQESLHESSDKRFYWNLRLYKEFVSQDLDPLWLIPIIQGFFSVFHDNQVTLALISRRSCERAGTRYNCRGIDEGGNVANFVETEQVMVAKEVTFSYLQLRGSVPIFWEQTGVTAQLGITKSREMSTCAFRKHADKLIEKYNHVTMINLLSSAKSYENLLTAEWEKVFYRVYPGYTESMSYTYFDFHANCKGQKFHKVNMLIENIANFLDYYCFYASDGRTQQGVVRTNCLDCLDRTNVVQSFIAWEVIRTQLRSINMDYTLLQDTNFTKAFKLQWADNGDHLSLQYTGTGSTISAVTREGRLGIKGLISQSITSINRFYIANVQDDVKQTSIDAFLRKKNKTQIVNKIHEELERRSEEFSSVLDIRIRVVTWNLGKKTISHIAEISESEDLCNIVVFGFQQVKDFPEYEDLLANSMKGYAKLTSQVNGDYAVVVYVEEKLIDDITMFDFDTVYLPYHDKPSSKQSTAITFNLYESSFCFVCCHLVSGTDNNKARKEQISYLQTQSFGQSSKLLEEFDCKVLFGDLNFRLNLNTYQILTHLSNENYEELFNSEQLTHNLKFGYLSGYKEPPITFPPTYPYEEGTSQYDKFKTRGPSWCDRILYSGKLANEVYRDINISTSSHRPVEAQFLLTVKKVDPDRKKQTEEKIYEDLLPMPLGTLPKMACAKDLLSCN